MRAIEVTEFGDAGVVEVTERDLPEPREGQVRIEVRASGIDFADVLQRRGHYQGGPEPPYVPGMEVAGAVDASGGDVDREEARPSSRWSTAAATPSTPSRTPAAYSTSRAR